MTNDDSFLAIGVNVRNFFSICQFRTATSSKAFVDFTVQVLVRGFNCEYLSTDLFEGLLADALEDLLEDLFED